MKCLSVQKVPGMNHTYNVSIGGVFVGTVWKATREKDGMTWWNGTGCAHSLLFYRTRKDVLEALMALWKAERAKAKQDEGSEG